MTRTKLVGFIVSGLLLVGAVFTLHHEPALAAPMEMAEAKKQRNSGRAACIRR